jgi:hypothetical protein
VIGSGPYIAGVRESGVKDLGYVEWGTETTRCFPNDLLINFGRCIIRNLMVGAPKPLVVLDCIIRVIILTIFAGPEQPGAENHTMSDHRFW